MSALAGRTVSQATLLNKQFSVDRRQTVLRMVWAIVEAAVAQVAVSLTVQTLLQPK